MPNIKHTFHDGKVHILLGNVTACGHNINVHREHWSITTESVNCQNCKNTRK